MITIPFIYVPVIALFSYLFLLIAFLAAKKNTTIYSFMVMLVACILWTGGSMCMRLQLYPGIDFWYEVSILSLFTTPLLLYNFVCNFLEVKGYVLKIIWLIGTVIILILTHLEIFLKHPQLVYLDDGSAVFLYEMGLQIIIPTLFLFVVLLSIALLVVDQIKKKGMSTPWLPPILIGMASMFVGNLASILPNNIFPWDTLSGIVNAFFLFYALYKKRLFRLKLLVSHWTLLVISTVIVFFFFAYLLSPLEKLIDLQFPQFADYKTLIIAITFVAVLLIFYLLLRKFVDNMFIKEGQLRTQLIKDFTLKVSKSLDLDEILKELLSVVKNVVDVEKVYICMKDEKSNSYNVVCSASPLDPKDFSLALTNPCVQWFNDNDSCLIIKEFQRSTLFRSMWENEKKQISDLKIGCMVPLKWDKKLVGLIMLSEKIKNAAFNFDDITFLDSVQSIASIAINNANLYKKAYYEARIDTLTGLLNRKYFYEKINEEFEKCQKQSLALVILNIDDFKLYNQLYGNREGDIALQNISRIIKNCLGNKGFAARYGGKEFALILPNCDTMQAFKLASEIKQQIANLNKGTDGEVMKVLTLSGGVCVYPYSASNVKQLIDNVDMAVYNAKRSGKNKILVYSMERTQIIAEKSTSKIETGKYSDYASTIYALTAAIDAKDHYTFSHSQNVAEYATMLAKFIGLNEDHVQIIYEAALLHDIGKISIPEAILSKPGRLTAEEYRVMQTHVESSIAIIRHLPSMDYVIPAAIAHHERWDGNGYPRGIKGEDIPIAARCLAIADAFDAMTSERPYKKPLSVELALKEIDKQAGLQFDPHLAQIYVGLVKEGNYNIGA
ncbi:MAG: HD domain-containing phosphohydrolase [Bacillota bacterium]|jgi:diguanylate cyclase (GGDEF)-like protein/putative nucleotidyltransferase with HDIG domain